MHVTTENSQRHRTRTAEIENLHTAGSRTRTWARQRHRTSRLRARDSHAPSRRTRSLIDIETERTNNDVLRVVRVKNDPNRLLVLVLVLVVVVVLVLVSSVSRTSVRVIGPESGRKNKQWTRRSQRRRTCRPGDGSTTTPAISRPPCRLFASSSSSVVVVVDIVDWSQRDRCHGSYSRVVGLVLHVD